MAKPVGTDKNVKQAASDKPKELPPKPKTPPKNGVGPAKAPLKDK
ncbi:hypothetical protein [Rhizobium leguminosarum]|nr:hypothetical protein [Rhizobium leguminosarum]